MAFRVARGRNILPACLVQENPLMLLEMLDGKVGFGCEAWLGRHMDGRSARKAYLALARPQGGGI
jgi:hypothetical protein